MQEFTYIARNAAGEKLTGTLVAASREEAVGMLGGRALYPVKVEPRVENRLGGMARRKPRAQQIAVLFGQLADLLRSGVPLLRSLEVLQRQTSNARLKLMIEDLRARVEEGASLADAMGRDVRVFGEMAVSMVRAGGEGGFLEESLDRVAEFTEKQEDLRSRVIGALAYPTILAVVGATIVTVLMIFFVPQFSELFSQLRANDRLPMLTDWLLWLSDALRQWGWLLLALLVGLTWLARVKLATEAGRHWLDRLKLKLPVGGTIFLNLAVARFCRVLGTLLRNGVPILKALEISSDATGNRVLGEAICAAAENISAGERLAVPLAACGHFPPAVIEMVAVAEESNTLERVLLEIADGLERRTWRQLDLFVRLLEPFMLLIMAALVLAVVIALLLPMIRMSSAI